MKLFRRDIFPQDFLERQLGRHTAKFVHRVMEHFVDDEFIFFRFEGTRGIHQPSRRERGLEAFEQADLARVQIGKIFGSKPPANLRMPRERAGPRAGRIDQNAIERAFERQRLRPIERDAGSMFRMPARSKRSAIIRTRWRVQVRRDYMPVAPLQPARAATFFLPEPRKDREPMFPGATDNKIRHRLGSFVLNRNPAVPHGFAGGRISSVQRPGVSQEAGRV